MKIRTVCATCCCVFLAHSCTLDSAGQRPRVVDHQLLVSDFSYGYFSGLKQPSGAVKHGLNLHQLNRCRFPQETAEADPDRIAWVDEISNGFGVFQNPSGGPTDYVRHPGGQVAFGPDDHIWLIIGGRAPQRPMDLYKSKRPMDASSFDLVLDDFETAPGSTVPCLEILRDKVFQFWRYRYSVASDSEVRFSRRDVDSPVSVELAQTLGTGSFDPELGVIGIEQICTRSDPQTNRIFVSWQWYDVEEDSGGRKAFGSNTFLYSDDLGATWRLADGRQAEVPLRYSQRDSVAVPFDHLANQERTSWQLYDFGSSPNGTFWMTVPRGDGFADGWRLYFYRWNGKAWIGDHVAGPMEGMAKPFAVGTTKNSMVLLFAELDSRHVLHAIVSRDNGTTWSDRVPLLELDAGNAINWISTVQPAGDPDGHARFFIGYYRTQEGSLGRRFRNSIRWIKVGGEDRL